MGPRSRIRRTWGLVVDEHCFYLPSGSVPKSEYRRLTYRLGLEPVIDRDMVERFLISAKCLRLIP